MKIIRILPQAAINGAKEKIVRVLTFANGSYALHFADSKGQSFLSLYDWQGTLIKEHVRAESAYIFKNGSYILLYEPTNNVASAGKVRFRREYRMFSRNGKLVFDDISSFVPLAGDWVVLLQNGTKTLYDDKYKKVDSGTLYDFVKFDGGYARVSAREIFAPYAVQMMPGDIGKWLPYNTRLNSLYRSPSDEMFKLTYHWELFDENKKEMYSVDNGIAVFGGGYMLALNNSGKIIFYYPDGIEGTETTLDSGARKNIACLVNKKGSSPKKNAYERYRNPSVNYRLSRETKDNVSLAYQLRGISDVYEFSNGNFSCVSNGKLYFYEENIGEPLLTLPASENVCFLPDGRYWNIDEKTLCNQTHKVVLEDVDAVADLGDWYIVSQKGVHTVYDSNGNRIAGKVCFIRKVNGILVLRLENGQIGLVHRHGKAVLPPMDEWRYVFEERAF